MQLLSLNLGRAHAVPYTDQAVGVTGIDKRPVAGPVRVTAPGPKGVGASGLAGDTVCDLRHHGGNDQAVYTVAREDLDDWERELGRPLVNGAFGENLTTRGWTCPARGSVSAGGSAPCWSWRSPPDASPAVRSRNTSGSGAG